MRPATLASLWLALACADAADTEAADTAASATASADTGAVDTAPDTADDGAVGTPCAGAERHVGEATYYDFADGSGNCGFPATPDDPLVAAMNHTDYATSAACGACVRIDGPDGSVDVRIVDRCPECPAGDIDLHPDAFARIAPVEAGRVAIAWQYIPCAVEGPVIYHFKDGSNPWWTAVQVRNHRNAIAAFEVHDGSSWIPVGRVEYNYFVQDAGMGEGPLSFRVTDVAGNTIEDAGIPLLDDADAAGAGQFPGCGG